MKKFVFRFQTLLDTKIYLEEMYENELAILIRTRHDEETRLGEMKRRLAEYYKEYAGHREATIEEIRRYRDYFDKLNNDIELQKQTVEKAAGDVETKREELILVQKEKLALEKLKEKDYRKHQDKVMMWERKFLDEIATSDYIRNGGNRIN